MEQGRRKDGEGTEDEQRNDGGERSQEGRGKEKIRRRERAKTE